jgi:hypothetical protein
MQHFWRFFPATPTPQFQSLEAEEDFISKLSQCVVRDLREEIEVLAALASVSKKDREKEQLLKEILRLLNKLAHNKYRVEFAAILSELRTAAPTRLMSGPRFMSGLDIIEERARKRAAAGHSFRQD